MWCLRSFRLWRANLAVIVVVLRQSWMFGDCCAVGGVCHAGFGSLCAGMIQLLFTNWLILVSVMGKCNGQMHCKK